MLQIFINAIKLRFLKGGVCLKEVPIWEKTTLTLDEAAAYTGIGIGRLREITDTESNTMVLWVGSKRLIKRKALEKYVEQTYSI